MKKISTAVLFLALSIPVFSQKVTLTEGDLSALKGQSTIAVEFVYDGMSMGDGTVSEQDYVARKTKEFNEKEPGRGDKWAAAWVADRKNRFEPKFLELLTKYSKLTANGSNAKYTMIFKTTRTEPFVFSAMSGFMSKMDGEALIVETANKSKTVAKLTLDGATGKTMTMMQQFDTGERLEQAYAKSGKEIGAFISKKIK